MSHKEELLGYPLVKDDRRDAGDLADLLRLGTAALQ